MQTLVLLLICFSLLTVIELVVSPPGRRRSRRANLTMIVPVLVAATVTDVVVAAATTVGDDHHAGLVGWAGLRGGVGIAAAVVLLDLAAYTSHRVRHRVASLWTLHRAHHTDVDMDVTTSFRNHPLDVVALNLGVAIGVAVVGAGASAVVVMGALTAIFGLWDHGRIRLHPSAERVIGTVFQTPGLHRMHHSPYQPETDSNFGLVLTVWDRMFRSFSPPNPEREVGLDTLDLDRRQSFMAMLAEPWRPMVKEASPGTAPLPQRVG